MLVALLVVGILQLILLSRIARNQVALGDIQGVIVRILRHDIIGLLEKANEKKATQRSAV